MDFQAYTTSRGVVHKVWTSPMPALPRRVMNATVFLAVGAEGDAPHDGVMATQNLLDLRVCEQC